MIGSRAFLSLVLGVALAGVSTPVAAMDAATPTNTVRIPAGEYTLEHDRARRDARPPHRVRLAAFDIDRFEITNAQLASYLNTLPVRVLRDAPAGAARASDIAGDAAHRLLEGRERDERETLYALDDEQARVMLSGGRFVAAPGFENHPE